MTSSEPDQYTGLELPEISGWSKTDDGYSIEWEAVETIEKIISLINLFILSLFILNLINLFILTLINLVITFIL